MKVEARRFLEGFTPNTLKSTLTASTDLRQCRTTVVRAGFSPRRPAPTCAEIVVSESSRRVLSWTNFWSHLLRRISLVATPLLHHHSYRTSNRPTGTVRPQDAQRGRSSAMKTRARQFLRHHPHPSCLAHQHAPYRAANLATHEGFLHCGWLVRAEAHNK